MLHAERYGYTVASVMLPIGFLRISIGLWKYECSKLCIEPSFFVISSPISAQYHTKVCHKPGKSLKHSVLVSCFALRRREKYMCMKVQYQQGVTMTRAKDEHSLKRHKVHVRRRLGWMDGTNTEVSQFISCEKSVSLTNR